MCGGHEKRKTQREGTPGKERLPRVLRSMRQRQKTDPGRVSPRDNRKMMNQKGARVVGMPHPQRVKEKSHGSKKEHSVLERVTTLAAAF